METKNKKTGIRRLRTFKSDVAEYIKDKNISVVDIASARAKKESPEKFFGKKKKKENSNNNIIGIFLVFFVISAIVAVGFAGFLFVKKQKEVTTPVIVLERPIISPDDEEEISIEQVKEIQDFYIEKNKLLYFPIVKSVQGVKKLVGSIEFFKDSGIKTSLGFFNVLENKFMLAKFRTAEDIESPMLILKINSYESAFAGMLKWEKRIAYDLGGLFNIKNLDSVDGIFTDKEIKNRDTRVLVNNEDRIILIYSFVGKKYLVITTSEDAIKEIFKRLSSARYLNE